MSEIIAKVKTKYFSVPSLKPLIEVPQKNTNNISVPQPEQKRVSFKPILFVDQEEESRNY